jgi:hypothetical protein
MICLGGRGFGCGAILRISPNPFYDKVRYNQIRKDRQLVKNLGVVA